MASTAVSVDRNKEKEKEEGKREEGELIFFRPNGLSPKLEHLRPPRGRRQLSRVRAIHVGAAHPADPSKHQGQEAIYRAHLHFVRRQPSSQVWRPPCPHSAIPLAARAAKRRGTHKTQTSRALSRNILPYPLRSSTHADTPPHAHSPAERATHCFRMVAIRPDACHQSSS